MTREDAIKNLNMISIAFVDPVTREQRKLINETFEMAIKVLKQEPCERFEWGIDGNVYKITKAKDGKEICQQVCKDAISREAVIKCLERGDTLSSIDHRLVNKIKRLPPVTPSRPSCDNCKSSRHKGHWITENNMTKCSECGRFQRDCRYGHTNYCNHCGAEMLEQMNQ